MTKRVNKVPTDKPPTSTIPMARRVSAPAPDDIIKGSAPKTMAPVVIRIGRNRNNAACDTASITDT
jgi:hypothetical protein